jgi:hypothetical protein
MKTILAILVSCILYPAYGQMVRFDCTDDSISIICTQKNLIKTLGNPKWEEARAARQMLDSLSVITDTIVLRHCAEDYSHNNIEFGLEGELAKLINKRKVVFYDSRSGKYIEAYNKKNNTKGKGLSYEYYERATGKLFFTLGIVRAKF